LWSRTYGGTGIDFCHSACMDARGNIALTGESPRSGAYQNFRIVLVDQWGDSLTGFRAGGANDDVCYSVIALANRGFLMSGRTYSYPPIDGNFWILRTTPLPLVPAPQALTIHPVEGALQLRWEPVNSAVGYRVLQAPSFNGPWTSLGLTQTTFFNVPVSGSIGFFAVTTISSNERFIGCGN
jgi:hypothetical protein